MTPKRLLALALTAAIGLLAWWLWPAPPSGQPQADRLLPALIGQETAIQRIELRGAGNVLLASLQHRDGAWTVVERDWPASAGRVQRLLQELAEARRIEPKTRQPARYARLGVEPVDAADAAGVELLLLGEGFEQRLVLGDTPPGSEHRFVRVVGEVQAWRVDRALEVPREVGGWLDRRLIDRPVARIERVEVRPAKGRGFSIARVGESFGMDGMPADALADRYRGDALAGLLDALQFEDVAVDGHAPATQVAHFFGVDGLDVGIEAWAQGVQVWARCKPSLDAARAAEWAAQAGEEGREARLQALRDEASTLQARCDGRAFRLPEYKARNLMRSREQYLAD